MEQFIIQLIELIKKDYKQPDCIHTFKYRSGALGMDIKTGDIEGSMKVDETGFGAVVEHIPTHTFSGGYDRDDLTDESMLELIEFFDINKVIIKKET